MNSSDPLKQKSKSPSIFNLKIAATSLFLIISWWPSIGLSQDFKWEKSGTAYIGDIKESVETSDESLFKTAVAEALKKITDLKQIPKWWIQLKYKEVPEWDLPKTLDFFPKEVLVKEGIPYSIVEIGTQIFKVTPRFGAKIEKISLDKSGYHVVAGGIPASKDIEKEMGVYLRKLNTKWEFWYYLGSTVTRVTVLDKDKIFRDLEAYNTPKKTASK